MAFFNRMRTFLRHPIFIAFIGVGSASAIARVSLFLIFAVGARQLDINGYAGLLFVIGTSQMLSQFSAMGWSNLITRMTPRFGDEDAALRRGFVKRSFQFPAGATLAAIAGLLIVSMQIHGDPALAIAVRYTAFTLPLVTLCLILRSYLAGMGRPFSAVFQSETLPMAGTLALLLGLGSSTLEQAVACYVVAHVFAVMLQAVALYKPLGKFLAHAQTQTNSRQWVATSLLTLVGFGGKLLMDRTDTLLLAPIAGMEALAQYGSVTRLTLLLLFVPTMLLPIFGPRVSAAYHAGDNATMRRLVTIQVLVVAGALAPLVLFLLWSPAAILDLAFGGGYAEAAGLVPLVIVTQCLFALSLPFSSLMLMTSGEMRYALASFYGCIVNFGLGIPLIHLYGVTGAAIATFLGVLTMTLALVPTAIRLLRR